MTKKKSACPPALDTADKTLAERDSQAKRLKKEVSDVSVDAEGLRSSSLEDAEEALRSSSLGKSGSCNGAASQRAFLSFLRKRLGSKAHAKPAALAKRAKKRPSAQQDVTAASEPSSGARLPWLKLKKVNATKPETQYSTGTKEPGSKKLKLVVEVTKKRSSKFAQHIDTIMSKMRTNRLTKEEALQLREDLCQQD